MFQYSVILLAFLPAIILANPDRVTIQACRDGGHLPTWVAIEGCNQSGCTLSRSKPVTVSGEVLTQENSESLVVSMHGYLTETYAIEIALPAEVADGCQVLNCPLTKGQTVALSTTTLIEIESWAVGFELPIELSAINEQNKRVFCVRTTVKITE